MDPTPATTVSRDFNPNELLTIAAQLLSQTSSRFVAGLGAKRAHTKRGNDFATIIDLELEQILSAELLRRTGIAVHGEEYGGPDLSKGALWVVDPIDGTDNYSAGVPVAGILVALVHDGRPVLGLTWLPLSNLTCCGAVGVGLTCNGTPAPRIRDSTLRDSIIACSAFNVGRQGKYPGSYRLNLFGELSKKNARMRIFGSTGFDLALVASGKAGGAISFGHHAWDNAAGAALVLSAGGRVSDIEGRPWSVTSSSIVAGAPGVHEELLAVISSLARP